MVGRTKTVTSKTLPRVAFACALLLGTAGASQELRAQTAWGGNKSVTVNESVLDSLGPAGRAAGNPYQQQPGAYGGYTRYGGALLFPPQQVPRSTLTVPPPSAEALRSVPPLPRSAPRATATARVQPRTTPQAVARTPAPAAPVIPQTAAKPQPEPARAAPEAAPKSTAPTALAPPPLPPQPPEPVAAAEAPKANQTEQPKPTVQTASTAGATTNGTATTKADAAGDLDEMDLPPPAPLPSLGDEAEPMVPTVGLSNEAAEAPRQTLFTGGPSPSGIVLGGAPAAPPPPPPAPEPLSANDAKQTAPRATSGQTSDSTAESQAADSSVPPAPQPTQSQEQSAPKPAAPTQQAALTPATTPSAGEVRVPFEQAQIDLSDEQQTQLAPLADQLRGNERLAVRVQAYASGDANDPNKARRLSLQRALKVRKYFIDQGIRSVRVEVRALGMSGPDGSVDRVDVVPVQR